MRRHHDRLHALCRRLTGNDADALDATQEALISIARGLGRFDGRSAFSTWSYRIATNACLDELRRRRRRPIPGLPDDLGGAPPTRGAGSVDADDRVDALADRLAIDHALSLVPVEFRVPVVLRDLCDLDYATIADVLDIPPGTVRSRIARGRAQLANLLDQRNQRSSVGRATPRSPSAPPPSGSLS